MGVLGQVMAVGAVVMLGFGLLQLAFFVGMRRRSPLVMRLVIAMTKRLMNPRQMQTAGTPGAYASIIRHRGRHSGRDYETPVGIVGYGDDFVISLPYGTTPDWLQNVLAAGTASIVHEGRVIAVDRAELVPVADVDDAFTPSERRTHRMFRIDHVLRLRRVEAMASRGLGVGTTEAQPAVV